MGSVFSPRYAARVRRGERAMPAEHPAVNLVLYRRGRPITWVMSEYAGEGAGDICAGVDAAGGGLRIGGSSLVRERDGFRIEIVERSHPFGPIGGPVVGEIRVEHLAPSLPPCELSAPSGGARDAHVWQVMAPRTRVRARFQRPGISLDAFGYHDHNHGAGRLEDRFSRWGWARFHDGERTSVLYSLVERDGARRAILAESDGVAGTVTVAPPLLEAPPRRYAWGLRVPPRFGVSGAREVAAVPTSAMEQTPFYVRFAARLEGGAQPAAKPGAALRSGAIGLGEHLDLDRFRSRFVQFLLRWKTRLVPASASLRALSPPPGGSQGATSDPSTRAPG